MEAWYLLLFYISVACCSVDLVQRKGPGPGSLRNVSKNDAGVKKAVLAGTYAFNNQSNDAYLFRASAIDSAQRQIVKGILYHLEVKISRTVCRKSAKPPELTNCMFQPPGELHEIFLCHFQVWSMPWHRKMTTTFLLCKPQDEMLPPPYLPSHQSLSPYLSKVLQHLKVQM